MHLSQIVFAAMLFYAGNASAATFVVNNTTDPASPIDAGCTVTECTLREAITDANVDVVADNIHFNIPGAGELRINITGTPLPALLQPATIDGYTQPGTSPNTDPTFSNAVLRVRVDGSSVTLPSGHRIFSVCANNVTIRGLSITGFSSGIQVGILPTATACSPGTFALNAQGNFIGLTTAGVPPASNTGLGINLSAGTNTVGGTSAADRNVIAGVNNAVDIQIANATVLNNLLGSDPTGQLDFAGNTGISLSIGGGNATIGTATHPNQIRFFNLGISTMNHGTINNNVFFANHFAHLSTLAVDLHGNGVTANDTNDTDGGANGLQNFPVINTASVSGGVLNVTGSLDVVTTAAVGTDSYQLAFYASDRCNPTGHGNGERFLGSATRTLTNASENFTVTLPTNEAFSGRAPVLTMTATRATVGTSEFSQCFAMGPVGSSIVVNAADDVLGACDTTHCNLREAILEANFNSDSSTIQFAIPGGGPHRINVLSALPAFTTPIVVDGYSQPGASANTHAHASNAVLKIIVDYGSVSASPQFSLANAGSVGSSLRGLSLVGGTTGSGTVVDINGASSVKGVWFGVEPDGSTLRTYPGSRVRVQNSGAVIGGNAVADRNVIVASSSSLGTITNSGAISNVTIENNLLGLRPDGITGAANLNAIFSGGSAQTNVVIRNNTISCNTGSQIGFFGTLIEGNRIGTASDGITSPASCTTGRSQAAVNSIWNNNTLAFHNSTSRALEVPTATTGVVISRNRFFSNNIFDIDLGQNDHTPNDVVPLDPDTGANNLQNFPVIAVARRNSNSQIEISGTLNSLASTKFRIEFFGNDNITRTALSGAVNLAQARWIGSQEFIGTTDINGNLSFGPLSVDFPLAASESATVGFVVATATRLDASDIPVETSELSAATITFAPSGDLVVTNANASGSGSFFNAALEANARPDNGSNRDRITFNIPGSGPFLIAPPSQVINFTDRIEIDGYSQPSSSPNSATVGSNAVIQIELRNVALNFSDAIDALIKGVVIAGNTISNQPLLRLNTNSRLEGSFVGVQSNGTTINVNLGSSTAAIACASNGCGTIGGSDLASRNLIGIPPNLNASAIATSGNIATNIRNNLIGIQRDGITRLATPPANPSNLSQSSRGVLSQTVPIGAAGDNILDNTIGGFVSGVVLQGTGATLSGNGIGQPINGTSNIGNSGPGIWSSAGTQNTIESNVIRNNGGDGIEHFSGTRLAHRLNVFGNNGGLSMDIAPDGIANNDDDDTDGGPNLQQNYPVLTSAIQSNGGVVVSGALNSISNINFNLRFCYTNVSAETHGECLEPIGSVVINANTDSNGDLSFTTPAFARNSNFNAITATAARTLSGTEESSEFAANIAIRSDSQTAITSINASPARVGEAFAVNVAVTSSVPGVIPAGSVSITTSPNVGSCAIASLNAAGLGGCSITSSLAGEVAVTASYAGNANTVASSSAPSNLTIQKALTTTTITSDNADPSSPGAAITVTFTVASSAGIPTGTVEVSATGGGSCSGPLGAGSGFCSFTPVASGPIVLTANYLGDANFDLSSDSENHSVGVASSSLQINSITPAPSVFGQSITVNATLVSAFGTPAGPIVVSDGAGGSCQILSGNGSCNFVPVNVGLDQTVRADFAGDAAHTSSTSSALHSVNKANSTLTIGLPFRSGQPTEVPAQAAAMTTPVSVGALAPGAGTPTGTIIIDAVNGPEICVISLPATSCDLIPITAGILDFTVSYTGDSRFNASNGAFNTPVEPNALFVDGFECVDVSCLPD